MLPWRRSEPCGHEQSDPRLLRQNHDGHPNRRPAQNGGCQEWAVRAAGIWRAVTTVDETYAVLVTLKASKLALFHGNIANASAPFRSNLDRAKLVLRYVLENDHKAQRYCESSTVIRNRDHVGPFIPETIPQSDLALTGIVFRMQFYEKLRLGRFLPTAQTLHRRGRGFKRRQLVTSRDTIFLAKLSAQYDQFARLRTYDTLKDFLRLQE